MKDRKRGSSYSNLDLQKVVNRLHFSIKENGISQTGYFVLRHLMRNVLKGSMYPSLSEIGLSSSGMYFSPSKLLSNIEPHLDLRVHKKIRDEYFELLSVLRKRYRNLVQYHSIESAVDSKSSFLLYALIRLKVPRIILETGVANGHSTFFALNALTKNSQGSLYSVDLSENVGSLLTNDEKSKWNLKVLDRHSKKKGFRQLLDSLPGLDLFVHDSDHSYAWQKFEYESVFAKMSPDSFLASDDIDSSYAFLDFSRRVRALPFFLVGKKKIFGIMRIKPTNP